MDPEVFAREHWDRAPLLSRASDLPAPFTDLLSADDVDEIVAERGLREPFFRMVRQGSPVRGTTRTITAGDRRLPDAADPEAVRTRWAEGGTLVLNALHRTWPAVARFCRELAEDLGHPTQCNAYVTPGGEAQGFAYHHDTHDVFVLQVDGRKRWTVHAPVLERPLPSQPRAGADLVPAGAEPLLDVVLEPGDALYLPRGYVHAASTTQERSVHLTVGVLVVTRHDLLRDLLALAADEPELRRALPLRAADGDRLPGHLDALLDDVRGWLATVDAPRLAGPVGERLGRAVPPEPLGVLAQTRAVETLTAATPVRPRRGLPARVEDRGERVVLHLPDRVLDVPALAGPGLRAALAGPCTPAALAGAGLGLDEADALVLVRRLLREGVLAPA